MGTLVEVIDTKEKGSDVNLAAYLLRDSFKGEYDAAVVISNDSDLATPVRMVRKELGRVVGILNPHANHAFSLQKANPKFHAQITTDHLTASQFPATLTDAKGTITKPLRGEVFMFGCREVATRSPDPAAARAPSLVRGIHPR